MRTRTTALVVGGCLALPGGIASALPRAGEAVADARVEDADGRPLSIGAQRGRPALILYEDRDSVAENAQLKADLSRLAAGGRYKTAIALVAVADVSSFDFWPVKGFVKDAIRKQSREIGTTIYCDWSGSFRSALGLRPKSSNVIVVDRAGKVRFAASGPLDAGARRRVLDLLKAEVAP